MMNMIEELAKYKIIAILRKIPIEQIIPVVASLTMGGIRFLELTMNSPQAAHCISELRERFPDVFIGAGTVLNLDMAKEAIQAGAQFLISPNVDEQVIKLALEKEIDVWPGAMTPTEIVRAWEAGAQAIKLFPAEQLGSAYLKAIRAPLDHIPLIATGGINVENASSFLSAGAFAIGLGGQLTDPKLIQAGQYEQLTALAEKYVSIIRGDAS